MDKIVVDSKGNKYNITKQILHGLSKEQYIKLLEYQNFKCYLSGISFEHSKEKQRFLDRGGRKSPPIDHDHKTGIIRGVLSEKVNMLVDQWEKYNAYGTLSKPEELTAYQNRPPAVELFGEIKYKK